MARRRETAKGEAVLTPRKREWLRHLRACASRGETRRAYARRHGLSEQALYQAARELRGLGMLVPASVRRGARKPATFVRVTPGASSIGSIAASPWRVRLPNGVVLEGSERFNAEWLEALARL
jgi:hypothetical protein